MKAKQRSSELAIALKTIILQALTAIVSCLERNHTKKGEYACQVVQLRIWEIREVAVSALQVGRI